MRDLLKDSVVLKITRTIEKALYDALLLYEYTPDRVVFAEDSAGFDAKQTDIKDRKGFAIGLFGHGAATDRKEKFVPRIVVTGLGFLPGSVGNDKIPYYLKNGVGKYDKLEGQSFSSTYRFEIELSSNKAFQDIVMEAIRGIALPNLTYLPIYDQPQDSILLEYGAVRQMPELKQGLIQKIYTYEVIDVFETMPVTISSVISKIKQITVTEPDDELMGVPDVPFETWTADSTIITADSTIPI